MNFMMISEKIRLKVRGLNFVSCLRIAIFIIRRWTIVGSFLVSLRSVEIFVRIILVVIHNVELTIIFNI
jgi:hypothetical protein